MRLKFPRVHLIACNLSPELRAVAADMRDRAQVYSFETTADWLWAWRLARANDTAEGMQADAVVWLQGRSGEFSQVEVDAVQISDPLAKCVIVAGCWSEGEPRSGRPLQGVTRVYWHQGAAAVLSDFSHEPRRPPTNWIAIHAAGQLDYQGVAGLCHSCGQHTIWQAPQAPVISSEPAVRIFVEWSSWEAWQKVETKNAAPAILLQSFPRPADFERARAVGIDTIIAQPSPVAALEQALAAVFARSRAQLQSQQPVARHVLAATHSRRLSA